MSSNWTEVYTRCMDGEYFRGPSCPRDGHSNETSIGIADLVDAIRAQGARLSLETLVDRGFTGPLDEVIVLQVASPDGAPDCFRTSKGTISIV
jgi:hypothetical protein